VISQAELAFRRGDASALTQLETQLVKDRGTWLAHFRAGLLRLRSNDPTAALEHLNWCVEQRHEAAAAFLDDVPTMRYWADLWYWSAVASEAIGDRQTASSHYSNFLAPRANAHDARSEDVRRRLARLQ